MIIVIDGPEKVGKTTLVHQLASTLVSRGHNVAFRKWGLIFPDDRVYLEPLSHDVVYRDTVTIWDRSWASEHVYGRLLKRNRRLAEDPWLGEWLYGRAVTTAGLKVMLEGDPKMLAEKRDSTDLPVDPFEENKAFSSYAEQYGWWLFNTQYSESKLKNVAGYIVDMLELINPPDIAPAYAGDKSPAVIFVGEVRSQNPQLVGAWLPFTSRYTTEFARPLSSAAMRCGWTNAHEIAPQKLRNARVIVSCGGAAKTWVKNYVVTPGSLIVHLNLPHPSWTYRYNSSKTELARVVTKSVLWAVEKFVSGSKPLSYLVDYAKHQEVLVS